MSQKFTFSVHLTATKYRLQAAQERGQTCLRSRRKYAALCATFVEEHVPHEVGCAAELNGAKWWVLSELLIFKGFAGIG